jgi:sulfur-carrier protein adenylyltransferase/sulfurtransferase
MLVSEKSIETMKIDHLPKLSNSEILRYGRQLLLPQVGLEGQKKLKNSSVLIVGAGGLGSPMAIYLAAAGIGKIGFVDFDDVEESNLHRQILYKTENVGRNKTTVAQEYLHALNPFIDVKIYNTRLGSFNALEIFKSYNVVADGTDNFATRYLVNDACVLLGKPNVYGSVNQFEGQVTVFDKNRGPCYRCLYPNPPDPKHVQNCAEAGVLGVLPGIIGTLQATETIKTLLRLGDPLIGQLLLYDALEMTFKKISVRKNSHCPVCGENPSITELIDYEAYCGTAEKPSTELKKTELGKTSKNELFHDGDITPVDLFALLKRKDKITILDVREPHEVLISALDNAIYIPKGEISTRLTELDKQNTIVVVCKIGERSGIVAHFLRSNGFSNVWNLTGGLNRWAMDVDPNMPRY